MGADKYRAAVIHARSEKLRAEETPTKRALSDEKRHECNKEIRQIRSGNDVPSDGNVIRRVLTDHFKELFGEPRKVLEEFKAEFMPLIPKLDEQEKTRLERPISAKEIEDAIDGIPGVQCQSRP